MKTIGDDIVSLLGSAKHNALVVAPFMRSEALSPLLDSISDGVEITVVTRWRPTDLLSGVSDLDIYDVVKSKNAALYIRHDLHAKHFAADDRCLIGSANVTLTALGWRTPANLELLTPISRKSQSIINFEKKLFSGAILATAQQHDFLTKFLSHFRKLDISIPNAGDDKWYPLLPDWIPQIRNPEELYSVYNQSTDVSRTALKSMKKEIDQIGVIPGLNEEEFRIWIAAKIGQAPLIVQVIQHIEEHGDMTEDALSDILNQTDSDETRPEAREVLQVLKHWLTYFLQTHYQTAPDSIKLIRAKNI